MHKKKGEIAGSVGDILCLAVRWYQPLRKFSFLHKKIMFSLFDVLELYVVVPNTHS